METQENIKNFKPNDNQLKFLELYLSQEFRRSIEDMSSEIGINPATYYLWRKSEEFCKWFYDQIQVQKHRHTPDIVMNAIRRAKNPECNNSDIELALRILDVYTPTTKQINENYDINYVKMMEIIKEKATALSKLEVSESGIINPALELVEKSQNN